MKYEALLKAITRHYHGEAKENGGIRLLLLSTKGWKLKMVPP